MTTPARIPDWFDLFWEEQKSKLPVLLRNDSVKKLARDMMDVALKGMAYQATTPQGIRALIAFSRIAAIVKGVNGVCDAPDPSPEEVAAAVERLMQRVKP